MAKIKSYTDLQQSKKLAEILPIETADMRYKEYTSSLDYSSKHCDVPSIGCPHSKDVPCWSLAALLGVMPQINEWITPYGHKNDKLSQFEPKICKIWKHSFVPSYKVTYGNELSTDVYDNPVDAFYDMIIRLHELNLL